jgi:hypothetical protein
VAARGGSKEAFDGIVWFAFEDAWKVWLDGKLVSSSMRMQSAIVEDVQVAIALEPGEHALVVLVADHKGASAFLVPRHGPRGEGAAARARRGRRHRAQK